MYFPGDTLSQDTTVLVSHRTPHFTVYNPYAIPEVAIDAAHDTSLIAPMAPSVSCSSPVVFDEAAGIFTGLRPSDHSYSRAEFLPPFLLSSPPKTSQRDASNDEGRLAHGNIQPFDPSHNSSVV